jgi:hypothetical protein
MFKSDDDRQFQAFQAVHNAMLKWVYLTQKNVERIEAGEPATLKMIERLRLDIARLQVEAMDAGIAEEAFQYIGERAAFDAMLQLGNEGPQLYQEHWVFFELAAEAKLNISFGKGERWDLVTVPNIAWTAIRLEHFKALVWLYQNANLTGAEINNMLEQMGKAGLFSS